MKCLPSILSVGLFLLLVPCVLLATDVSGPVSGVWTAAGNPYYVSDSIYVPESSSLTIEAGVEVIFWGHFKFGVHHNAVLQVQGVEGDSVYFTTPWTEDGWWGLHFISSSPTCTIEYAVFEYGRATGGNYDDQRGGAIYCIHSSPTITHSRFSFCQAAEQGGAIYCRDDANPLISQCEITADTANYGAGLTFYYASPVVSECVISGNRALYNGGGIYAYNSGATISNNMINSDSARFGGGIYLDSSPAIITGNVISDNVAYYSDGAGGGIYSGYSNAYIQNNVISGNCATWGTGTSPKGGAIYSYNSMLRMEDNQINGNWANYGGALYVSSGSSNSPSIINNVISENYANLNGGAIYSASGSRPDIDLNEIRENYCLSSIGKGGAIYLDNYTGSVILDKNTFYGNWTLFQGGALYLVNSSINPKNSIFWNNAAPSGSQIYLATNSSALVTFSDVQGGWPGSGNLNVYPAFVDTAGNDFHLQPGSICIDHGDFNPQYNDPDFTPADMGCYHFPQVAVNPITLQLIPENPPIQVPFYGGLFQYTISVENASIYGQWLQIWCDMTLPWGAPYGPLVGPVFLPANPLSTRSSLRTQAIPINAPSGIYTYNAYLIVEMDTLTASFQFEKLPPSESMNTPPPGATVNDWNCWGEPWDEIAINTMAIPESAILNPAYPNPFNPTTTLCYELPTASLVTLSVYDISGRMVAELVNGMRDSGLQQVTWEAGGLPSGIYFARLTAGEYTAVQKLVLLK